MGMEFVWGSERIEKAFWRVGRAPVDAAMDSASRCSGDSWSVDDDCPIVASSSFFVSFIFCYIFVAEVMIKLTTFRKSVIGTLCIHT